MSGDVVDLRRRRRAKFVAELPPDAVWAIWDGAILVIAPDSEPYLIDPSGRRQPIEIEGINA